MASNNTCYVIVATASAGATTIILNCSPPSGMNSRAALLAIEPFSKDCELRRITGLSATVVTLNAALVLTHTIGTNVLFLLASEASPVLFGMLCDNLTNEWDKCQRMFIQATIATCGLVGPGNLHSTDTIRIHQPLLVSSGSRVRELKLSSPASGFVPVDALPGAMVILSYADPRTFGATASDDTFRIQVDPGHAVGNTIAFNAPYGETLPGGLVAGRAYYIKTKPTATTFTVSEISGGATVDLTTDGSGWAYTRISSLSRVYWDSVRLDLNQPDLNGFQCNLQQPGYTRNLRIKMNVAATALDDNKGVGLHLPGQVSKHYNMQIDPAANCTALKITGTSIGIFGIVMDGAGRGILIGNCDAIEIDGALLENLGQCIEIYGQARGINFGTIWHGTPLVKLRAGSNTSWSVYSARCASGGILLVDDLERNYRIMGWSAGDPITSDSGKVFGPFRQPAGYTGGQPVHPVYGAVQAKRSLSRKASLNFGSIAAQSTAELTITVSGAVIGDVAHASPNTTIETGLVWSSYVSATDTVTIRISNPTACAIDPAFREWRVVVHQFGLP